jgi:hypothetical protein
MPSGMMPNTCPFGGCSQSGGEDGKQPIVINNHTGGQCQCCDNKPQQPIIINNIIPSELFKSQNAIQFTPEQAGAISPFAVVPPIAQAAPPVINVHLPPQAAPQVNLSMPEIQMPSISVNVPPAQSAPTSATPSTVPSAAPGSSTSVAPSALPSPANSAPGGTASAAPSNAPTSTASGGSPSSQATSTAPSAEAPLDTGRILEEIESLRKTLMPFYDATSKPGSPESTSASENGSGNRGVGYGSSAGCCIPNIHVNVSPRFNQQLLTSPRDGAPPRYGFYKSGEVAASGQQTGQTTGTTALQPAQPPADVARPTQQGMQTAPRTNSTCDECEEDDDGIEFYINDRKRVKRQPALSNRFIALPKVPPREFA